MTDSKLEALKKLVAPPKSVPSTPLSWSDIESVLHARFPDDYKAYVQAYGVGTYNGLLGVGDVRCGDLVTLTNHLGIAQIVKREGRSDVIADDRFFPDDGGLFPIGSTGNGDTLWLRLSDGGVVLTDGDDTERDAHGGGIAAFLHDVLTGKHVTPILPSSFAKKKKPTFQTFQKKNVLSFTFDPPFPDFAEIAAALKAHLGKPKALTERSQNVSYQAPLVQMSAGTGQGGFHMSAIYSPGDEPAVRTLVEAFFAKVGIKPSAIVDAAKNPAWEPAPPNDAASEVEALRARVPPPVTPRDAKGNWAAIERVLGAILPDDFRQLIELYGNGTFGGSLRLFDPFAKSPEHALVRQWFARLPPLHLQRGSYPAATGFIPFIKSGSTEGLLPFGASAEGLACWHARDAANAWKVVFLTRLDGATFEAHPGGGGVAAHLLAALDGKLPFRSGPLRASFEA